MKVDCTIPESCELADLKDYAAEAVGEMAMDTGEKDLCIVEFSPYECFHQTTCAAPPCMETQVLTESEYAALAEKHENDETLSEEGMRMQRQTRKGESSHE